MKVSEKYLNDETFKILVDSIRSLLEQHYITPGETREAVIFAHYLYEIHREPRSFTKILNDLKKELNDGK
jgi:hypothetical protein